MIKHFISLSVLCSLLGACAPTGGGAIENNSSNNLNNANNTNNANNLNNTNSSNNTNNLNNLNNTTTLNNQNNTNNTTGCGDGPPCEFWQYCDDQGQCMTAAGYCAHSEECGNYERCSSGHLCERDTPSSCGFTYSSDFPAPVPGALKVPVAQPPSRDSDLVTSRAVNPGPMPPGYVMLSSLTGHKLVSVNDLIMPDYSDNMPLFPRALDFDGVPRCYETPEGTQLLFEAEAYDLYVDIVEKTTGAAVNTAVGFRTVIGIRGAYVGTFDWHLNSPDFFNDTMVLLWQEAGGVKRVKEFPVHTDTGDNNYTSTSSLLPNRLYKYKNGTHNGYNALSMNEWAYGRIYHTADDANANGHWDNYRNGWLNTGSTVDYIREGSAHNIHMGSVNAPLGNARVAGWSAGCQVHPGMANWTEFITNAWTASGDPVDYFLIDARDINVAVWGGSCLESGSHDCPYVIDSFPATVTGDTSLGTSQFDVYGCSSANEGGPEIVYELLIDRYGTLTAQVDCADPVDIDLHLLAMDDPNACLTRAHISFSFDVVPGRYLLVADSFVSGGTSLEGAYTLSLSID